MDVSLMLGEADPRTKAFSVVFACEGCHSHNPGLCRAVTLRNVAGDCMTTGARMPTRATFILYFHQAMTDFKVSDNAAPPFNYFTT